MANRKVTKLKWKNGREQDPANRHFLRRMLVVMMVCGIALFIPLVITLFKMMVVEHDQYESKAIANQTRSTTISADRGEIYDRNMNALASSVTVETVFLDPLEIEQAEEDVDLIATNLARILGVKADDVRELAADTKMRYKVVKRKVSEDVADEVRKFISDNDLTGIHLESDSKRTYPYSTLAAQIIGFTNAENVGAEGLEAYYDDCLEGNAGAVITTKGNYETEMLYSYEKYYEASDGDSLVLTLDSTVQYYLEKNMEAAIEKYDVQNGAFGLVMDVNSGEILGMATMGTYDPNDYLEITDEKRLEELDEIKDSMKDYEEDSPEYQALEEEYNAAVIEARLGQWRNRCVSDGYEPGSTFKCVTLAAALEEGAVTLNDSFYCGGTTQIQGRDSALHCWKAIGHGAQDTAAALQNSCNIAFANIGIKLGGEKLYQYVKDFGLMEQTGVDLPGEGSGYFFSKDVLADADSFASLTSASFGQTFKVTPIQLVRAIAAVVNGGYVLEPYVVSEVLDSSGNVVQKHEPKALRQVISEETSTTMRRLMESVVTDGTASNAQVAGFRIGGKTGTSEKIDVFDENGNPVEDKIVSFVGVAPVDDPQYVVLVALDTPSTATGMYISGGVMAAPTVRDVLADILPYLGVRPEYSEDEISSVNMMVPNVTGLTEREAAEELEAVSLSYVTVGDGDEITDQIPAAGNEVPGESQIILYMGEEKPTDQIVVPNLMGMTVSQANAAIAGTGLYLQSKGTNKLDGSVTVTSQSVAAGELVDRGTLITAEFTDSSAQD